MKSHPINSTGKANHPEVSLTVCSHIMSQNYKNKIDLRNCSIKKIFILFLLATKTKTKKIRRHMKNITMNLQARPSCRNFAKSAININKRCNQSTKTKCSLIPSFTLNWKNIPGNLIEIIFLKVYLF
jgi:hypothetical protein